MVLAALAIVWVVVLGSYARERMTDRRTDSVSAFHTQLSTLQRTHHHGRSMRRSQPGRAMSPANAANPVMRNGSTMQAETARRRRKNVLLGLATSAVITAVGAIVMTSVATILLAAVCVLAAAGYVALLVERQRVVAEQYAKVRPIRSVPTNAAVRRPPTRGVAAVASRR